MRRDLPYMRPNSEEWQSTVNKLVRDLHREADLWMLTTDMYMKLIDAHVPTEVLMDTFSELGAISGRLTSLHLDLHRHLGEWVPLPDYVSPREEPEELEEEEEETAYSY